MEKVRRSNEKAKARTKNVEFCPLQENEKEANDGIDTVIFGGDISDEELDYDDDLYIEDDAVKEGQETVQTGKDLSVSGQATSVHKSDRTQVNKNCFLDESEVDKDRNSDRPTTSGVENQDFDKLLRQQDEEKLLNNPVLQKMMKQFFNDQFKSIQKDSKGLSKSKGDLGKASKSSKNKTCIGDRTIKQVIGETVKSPSDTTIYAPALQQKLTPEGCSVGLNMMSSNQIPSVCEQDLRLQVNHVKGGRNEEINQISHFVEAVRLEQHPEDDMVAPTLNNKTDLQRAQEHAERSVIEAEKFRAVVQEPGNLIQNDFNASGGCGNFLNIGTGVSDDDFFHLTCHIDPSLIHKIEKGEFIELEKLLPKEKLGRNQEENRLEWVQRDGGTFLVPAQKDNKISSFRCWEQAFRAYATIYCGANPNRSKEIWQYITVINTAASSYLWDNVYNYDITFRHLMAFNPQRSWAVTYNQMWNLSMRDPIPRNNNCQNVYGHYAGNGHGMFKSVNSSTGNSSMQVKRNKSDYCWNFNRGVPCKFGAKCKFIERCKYCDSPSHGVNACQKLQKKESTSTGTTGTHKTTQ